MSTASTLWRAAWRVLARSAALGGIHITRRSHAVPRRSGPAGVNATCPCVSPVGCESIFAREPVEPETGLRSVSIPLGAIDPLWERGPMGDWVRHHRPDLLACPRRRVRQDRSGINPDAVRRAHGDNHGVCATGLSSIFALPRPAWSCGCPLWRTWTNSPAGRWRGCMSPASCRSSSRGPRHPPTSCHATRSSTISGCLPRGGPRNGWPTSSSCTTARSSAPKASARRTSRPAGRSPPAPGWGVPGRARAWAPRCAPPS